MRRSLGVAALLLYVLSWALPLSPKWALVALMVAGVSLVLVPTDVGPSPRVRALLASLFLFAVTSGFGLVGAFDRAHAIDASLSLLPACLLLYIVATQLDRRAIDQLAVTLVAAAALLSSIAATVAWSHPEQERDRWLTMAGYVQLTVPNDLLLLSIVMPFAVALLLTHRDHRIALAAAVSVVLSMVAIVLFQSRGALLMMAFSSLTVVTLLRPHRVWVAAAALFGIAVLVDGVTGFALSRRFAGSWGSRIPLWHAAWRMFLDAPLLGHGPGAFAVVGPDYIAQAYRPPWAPLDARHAPWPHSLYLELLAERGILGTMAFLGYIVLALRCAYSAYTKTTARETRVLAAAVLATLFTSMIAGLFELSIVRYWVLNSLALAGGMAAVLAERSEQ